MVSRGQLSFFCCFRGINKNLNSPLLSDAEEARVSKLKQLITSCAILPAPRDAAPHPVTQLSAAPLQPRIPSHRCADAEERGQKMWAFQVCTQQTVQQLLALGQSAPQADRKVPQPLLETLLLEAPKADIRTNSHVVETKHTTVVRSGRFRRSGEGNSLPLHLFASFPPPPLLHCSSGR